MRKLTPNMLWLCIDESNVSSISGSFYSIMRQEPFEFHDVNELLLQADVLFDEIGFPQSFQRKRSMKEEGLKPFERLAHAPVLNMNEVRNHKGMKNTYILLVNTRAHTNWQGIIMDTEFQTLLEFKDILDFVKFIV